MVFFFLLILCIFFSFLYHCHLKHHLNLFLFVCINPNDFCVLSLCPVKLLNVFINSNCLSVDSPKYSVCIIILCPNTVSLSSDYISYRYVLFYYISQEIPVVYSGSSDSEHHLVPAFNCNISNFSLSFFNFSLLNMSFAMGFGIHSLLGQESSALTIACLIYLSE